MSVLFEGMLSRLTDGLQVLPDKPEETPESALRALWHTAAGRPCSAHVAMRRPLPAIEASPAAVTVLERLVQRRLLGEPLAYITGRQNFMGLEMLSAPGALIPRAETELMARAAVDLLDGVRGEPLALDVCTGSGNVAYAMAWGVPRARVMGGDISEEALALAGENGRLLGMQDRLEFRRGDLLAPFDEPGLTGRIDLITSAPPYIQSGKVDVMAPEIASHEPREAFDGGPLGVTLLMRLVEESPRMLRSGGWLAFEVGKGQGPAMSRRLQRDTNYAEVRELPDAEGVVRALLARRA
ncbi:HemK family protein methyltransferase [Dyella lutea]|uniref:HemK family protein methyltransferase n=1 Tax=Dyella lutea TaxID=2950441 RepID=A0ABT1FES6_9GAMM|nr:HemK family protein methyltransferase [Dyella lutea]MCP1375865.1 HemK family protein methyltransferase [Dyella lutea]